MEQAKVLVGIATITPDRRFLECLCSFLRDAGKICEIETVWTWDKPLVEAQNHFADLALTGGFSHVLTLEDDHWGFTHEHLKFMLELNTHVCSIPYRSRHFPFPLVPMRFTKFNENGVPLFVGESANDKGVKETDLIGFGMTLIKTETFRILDKPYFRLNAEKYVGVGPRATDIDFCMRLREKNIRPLGCFDHRIIHREIDEGTYKEMLVEGILSKHSLFTAIHNIHKKNKEAKEKV